MYNLLVTAHEQTWDYPSGSLYWDRSRFLEYTDQSIRDRFAALEPAAITELCSLPALLAYEQNIDKPAQLGWITSIKTEASSIVFTVMIDDGARPLSRDEFVGIQRQLGINVTSELNRTHWAVKDVDLLKSLSKQFAPEYVKKNRVLPNANRVALKAVRSILDAAEPFDVTVENTTIRVVPQRSPAEPWPSGTWGLDEKLDGPWPQPLHLECSWPTGRTQLLALAKLGSGKYQELVSLLVGVRLNLRQLIWVNVAAPLREGVGEEVSFSASAAIVTRIPQEEEEKKRRARRIAAIRTLVRSSGLPRTSDSAVDAFRIRLSHGEVLPSPDLALRRLIHLALLKLPFLMRDMSEVIEGKPYLAPEDQEWTLHDDEYEDALDEAILEMAVDESGIPDVLSLTPAEPVRWSDARLDLHPSQIQPMIDARRLKVSEMQIARLCAALSSGKHLLLVGPPGTGKTVLADALAEGARNAGYCNGAFVATASADWSTFDTIGGYALEKNGQFAFRPGVFLRALEQRKWLLIDEVNRADIDRSFGELMTVLAGGRTDTPFTLPNGTTISIGPGDGDSHRMPPGFRVLATMNTWDKTSLFRLSYAVQRRFAVVYVGTPGDNMYAQLLDTSSEVAIEAVPSLGAEALQRMKRLFCAAGLLAHRPLGPAIALDMVRYQRHRQADGDGLAEAVALFLLPQLEGLDMEPAVRIYGVLLEELQNWATKEALMEFRARYLDLFPAAALPEL